MDEKNEFQTICSYDIICELSEQYENIYGNPPFNVSYWDPSPDFIEKMTPYLKFKYSEIPINYSFTYQLASKNELLKSFGFNTSIKDCIITPNGTTSIMLISHWMKFKNIKKLNLICPAYFSIVNNCYKEDIEIKKINIDILNNYKIDIDKNQYNNNVFWISNPLYSSGYHIKENMLETITQLLKNNIIIFDECVSIKGCELSHIFGNNKNFIGIYAPHKSICINGSKFSILVFNKEYESFFDQSVDFLCGGIDIASLSAIDHFLSKNFDLYNTKFYEFIAQTNEFIKNICLNNNAVFYDSSNCHYLTTIYFPNIPGDLGRNMDFVWEAIKHTGTIFIPGILNYYPDNSGFCFRINLARDSPQFRASIIRLINYLSDF